jgi:predicted transcriptional regulator
MTKDVMLTRIAAIVSSIEDGTPESMLYIFCDMNMDDWQMIRDVLVKAGFVTIKGHYVTLTASGRETARKLNEAIASKS